MEADAIPMADNPESSSSQPSPLTATPGPHAERPAEEGPLIPLLKRSVYATDLFKARWPDRRFTIRRAAALVRAFLRDSPQEQMVPVLLNERHEIVSYFCASVGPHNALLLESEDIFPLACEVRARGIVLVHNHPFGPLPLRPSTFDLELTEALVDDGTYRWHIPVCDHLILSNVVPEVFSFRQAKLLVVTLSAVIQLVAGDAYGLWGHVWAPFLGAIGC